MSRYSELIFLYLDGEATPEEQRELFEALGRDEELQHEFQQALQLHRAIDAERLTTKAPDEVKQAVYAAIGLVPTEPLWRRVVPYSTAAVAAVAVGVYLWLSSASAPKPSPETVAATDRRPIAASVVATPPHNPERSERLAVTAATPATEPALTNEAATTHESLPPTFDADEFIVERFGPRVSTASPLVRSATWRLGMVSVPIARAVASELPLLSAQFSYRGSLLAASGPAASPQNFSAVVLYRFDENHRLGVEFRRAPYTLNIAQPTGTLTTTLLSSVAVAYSFREPDVRILGGMPFVQPTVGISQLGPVATLAAGLSFPISNGFQLDVGLDGSALLYSGQVASNLGVLLGVNVGLPIR
jgi:hypothetical protein